MEFQSPYMDINLRVVTIYNPCKNYDGEKWSLERSAQIPVELITSQGSNKPTL